MIGSSTSKRSATPLRVAVVYVCAMATAALLALACAGTAFASTDGTAGEAQPAEAIVQTVDDSQDATDVAASSAQPTTSEGAAAKEGTASSTASSEASEKNATASDAAKDSASSSESKSDAVEAKKTATEDASETSASAKKDASEAISSTADERQTSADSTSSSAAARKNAPVAAAQQESTIDENGLQDNGVYSITSALGGNRSIDVPCGSTANSTQLQLYDSNKTLAQYYRLTRNSDGWYTISNVNSSKVFDVRYGGTTNGTKVQQYESNGTVAQQWKIVKGGAYYYLVPRNAQNMRLDVAAGNGSNGAALQIYEANGTKAQLFRFLLQAQLAAAFASGETLEDGCYSIASALDKSAVVDIASGSKDNAANAQVYQSNSTAAQKFIFTHRLSGLYVISNVGSAKVLDVDSGSSASGANVRQYTSNSTLAQMWYLTKAADGTYVIHSANSANVLDLLAGRAANGQNVQQYEANGTAAQRWVLTRMQIVNNGTYVIESSVMAQMVLDVANGSVSDGGNIQSYRSNGTDAQKFVITYLGNDLYSIKNVKSGKYLDVVGGSKDDYGNVQQYTWNDTAAQKWRVVMNDTSFMFQSACSGKFLDIAGGSRFAGANVDQYTENWTKAQTWILQDGSWSFYAGTSNRAMALIEKAEQYEGWKYVWGGRDPSQGGFDCAGLVMYCANHVWGAGLDLWNTNAERLFNNHCKVISAAEAQPGDFVFYRGTYGTNVNRISHVVIYCGHGIMYGAGDPIGYQPVNVIKNILHQYATPIYARFIS
jgi:hypothetical protein